MKALLVWPKFSSHSFWHFEKVFEVTGTKYMTPPLGLLTVAALLPADWELRVVDENVRPLTAEDYAWAELVMVSAKIVHRHRALTIIREARALGKTVVVGGPDPTLSPKVYARAGGNFLCLGEGEVTVPLLLADLARGVTEATYNAGQLPELGQSPVPRFDLINARDYLYVGIQFSRGCPYNCEFCNVIDLFSHRYRTKTPEQVLAELDVIYAMGHRGQVDFLDDNLAGNFKLVKPLLRAVAGWLKEHGYPFQFSTSMTLNIARDDELLGLLREARFKYLLVGIETPDQNALKQAQKPQNTGYSIPEAADRIYRLSGCTIHSGFLLGLDGEAPDIAEQIIKCIDETGVAWVMAGVVYPLPGTQLARRLDREKRLFPKARVFDDESVRDQISAGVQFRPSRPAANVLDDLVRVLHHSYDPSQYFARCADVATRINTVPVMVPGLYIFLRNVRTFFRLCIAVTASRSMRGPFWKALAKVLLKNPVGIEALATLSVLYLHFNSMLPYCYEQLKKQKAAIAEHGEAHWLEENLREQPGTEPASEPVKAPAKVAAKVAAKAPAQVGG